MWRDALRSSTGTGQGDVVRKGHSADRGESRLTDARRSVADTIAGVWRMKCDLGAAGAVWLAALGILILSIAAPGPVQAGSSCTFTEPQLGSASYGAPSNPYATRYRGECTWYVFGRVLEKSGVALEFTEGKYPGAHRWIELLNAGYQRTQKPESGAIAVWTHKTETDYGHVAYVEAVYGHVILFTEANFSVPSDYDGNVKASTIADFENNKGGKPWRFLGYVVPTGSTSQPDGVPFSRGQVWNGTYRCRQGLTALSFRISEVARVTAVFSDGLAYAVAAVFDFNFNTGEATGAFNLKGRY